MATKSIIEESLTFLKILGLDPRNQNKWTRIRTVFSLILFVDLQVQLALQIILNWRGIDSTEGATTFTTTYQISSKVVLMITQRQIFIELLNKIEQFWPLHNEDPKLQLKINAIYMATRKYIKVFTALMLSTVLSYFSVPFFTTARMLPLDTYYPTDRYQSPQYQFQYLNQVAAVVVGISLLIGFDGLFVSFIIRITCQFKIIKQRFLELLDEGAGDDAKCFEKVKELVIQHNLVLGCIKDMDKAYSALLLNQFLTSGVCICAGLVGIIADGYPPNMQNLSKYVIYITTFMSQLFFYCMAGTYLMAESKSVSEAVFESNWWVRTQPQLRRALVLVIQRANKTEKLTAGGMFTLDLESFTSVVNMSLSFFTLVQTMSSKTKEN